MTQRCRGCDHKTLEVIADYGAQPISNRYGGLGWEEYMQEMRLGICSRCGLLQLASSWPSAELVPRAQWLRYSEPEAHVASLAAIAQSVARERRAIGMSYKDDSTLKALAEFGFETDVPGGVIICRHMLEHQAEPAAFLEELKGLMVSDTIAMIEVPSASRMLHNSLHPLVWEEHTCYFKPETLDTFLRHCGFDILRSIGFEYEYEDCEVRFVALAKQRSARERPNNTFANFASAKRFGRSFFDRKYHARDRIAGHRVALFGAGHHAVHFVNYYDLAPYITAVVDDNEYKIGHTMPGSHLPIRSSVWLEENRVDLCVSTLTPATTAKVRDRLSGFKGMWQQAF